MILGLIPARGGSKGIPRKNLKIIAGKPLIVWSIEAAQNSRKLDRFVVSTEDNEIAETARQHGAEVIRRPAELATDEATTLSVWQHALSVIPADIIVNLYPTSPIRDQGLIDRTIERFLEVRPTSLATGFLCKYLPFGATDDGRNDIHGIRGRQNIGGFFYDDGNVYVVNAQIIHQGQQYGDRLEHFYNIRECSVEIDDDFDFWLAEQILKKRTAKGDFCPGTATADSTRSVP